jgi:hypothetical protein
MRHRLRVFFALAAALLLFAAFTRPPEYDEAYSVFLTAGDARPAWPVGAFTAGSVRHDFYGRASLQQIARDLRRGDVHPPLYFWTLEYWRAGFGPSWFAARLLSVGCTLAGLWLLTRIAGMARIPVLPALAILLLSYGFTYTGIIARGFALAITLNLGGTALALAAVRQRRLLLGFAAGLAFGAASFTNYLAIFTGLAGVAWLAALRAPRLCAATLAGIAMFVPPDLWFFLAQRGSRAGQFAPFSLRHAMALLARDSGAALFGALPLQAGPHAMVAGAALAVLFILCLLAALARPPRHALLFTLAAAATPCGLLALGLIFDNTPIELRYLCFSLPFLALLLAGLPAPLLAPLLAMQACAIVGLLFSPLTQQPQALAARQAVAIAPPGTLILLPYGNDGVGIPGPFIASLPDAARLALLRPGTPVDAVPGQERVLVMLSLDAASRAETARMASTLNRACATTLPQTESIRVVLAGQCR